MPDRVARQQLLSQVSAYDLFVFDWGFRPARPTVVDLFTCMFLHGGFLHLFGNMLFLWIYGDNVEHVLGRVRFLFWYLATGVAATLFHLCWAPGPPIPWWAHRARYRGSWGSTSCGSRATRCGCCGSCRRS